MIPPSDASVDFSPRTIGLIGGAGKMGALFGRLLEGLGYRVRSAGPSDDPGYGGLVAESDVLIVTVPITETVAVIERIARLLRADQLLADFTSIKREPVAAMLASPAWVIGCHPLFGPMPNPAGQNVVLCPARPGPCLPWLEETVRRLKMTPVVMTPQGHDEAMAFIQGLTHFLNITFARTLQTRGADIEALLKVCSPVYQVFFAMLSRILSGDPELYGQIQLLNRENIPVLQEFLKNGAELLGVAEGQRWEDFYKLFSSAGGYLGPFKAVARQESDFLIDQMRQYLERQGK
jgi:prephenate dehydrogenase